MKTLEPLAEPPPFPEHSPASGSKLLALAGPGFDPASADQLKPNRVRYRELRAKTPDKSGSMQTDGV